VEKVKRRRCEYRREVSGKMVLFFFLKWRQMLHSATLFLLCSALLEHDLETGVTRCLSHAAIESKPITVGPCAFHRRQPRDSAIFLVPTCVSYAPYKHREHGLQTRLGWVKLVKNADIRPINRHISETVEHRHVVTMNY